MIELKNFGKKYYNFSHKKILFEVSDLSLKITPGKITSLLGANGSGKSTIMKAICGFHYPSSGQIIITDFDENPIDVANQPEKARQLVGYVPEQSILPSEMRVLDFLVYSARLHSINSSVLDKTLTDVIEKCSLNDVLEKKIKELSKGYSQRVSFAQAIIHNPPNLILDEAITGLDPSQILVMRELILNLSKEKAILLSTHILQEVESLSDDICIIKNGKIAIHNTKQNIIDQLNVKSLEEAFYKINLSNKEQSFLTKTSENQIFNKEK